MLFKVNYIFACSSPSMHSFAEQNMQENSLVVHFIEATPYSKRTFFTSPSRQPVPPTSHWPARIPTKYALNFVHALSINA